MSEKEEGEKKGEREGLQNALFCFVACRESMIIGYLLFDSF